MSLLLTLYFVVSDFTKSSKKRFSVMYLHTESGWSRTARGSLGKGARFSILENIIEMSEYQFLD